MTHRVRQNIVIPVERRIKKEKIYKKKILTEEARAIKNERMRIYHQENKLKEKEYSLKYRTELRNKFFEMYGDKCVCCGEKEKSFLTLEHIIPRMGKNETGYKSRKKAIEEYRPDLYQVLCYNCNCGKIDGVCPHKLKK